MTAPKNFPFIRSMPVLDCSDIAAGIAFWRDKLGFDAGTWGEPPTFAILQRGTVSVGLARRPQEEIAVSRNMAAYLFVKDVDALYAEYPGGRRAPAVSTGNATLQLPRIHRRRP